MAKEYPIVDSVESFETALARVRAAQKVYATYTQEQVDKIFKAAALAANNMRIPLAKMAVIAAGPVFNFILAFVFSLVILSWAGIDPAVIAGTSEGMPAEAAGLREGDVITKLDGRKIIIVSQDKLEEYL